MSRLCVPKYYVKDKAVFETWNSFSVNYECMLHDKTFMGVYLSCIEPLPVFQPTFPNITRIHFTTWIISFNQPILIVKQYRDMITSSNGNILSLAFCVGISPVTGGFPSQRPLTRNFLWSPPKHTIVQTIETLVIWDAHYDVTVMQLIYLQNPGLVAVIIIGSLNGAKLLVGCNLGVPWPPRA